MYYILISASKSCQIVLSASPSRKISASMYQFIQIPFPLIYHILLCAQQPQPFHHLSTLHNAVVLRFRRSEWMAEGRKRLQGGGWSLQIGMGSWRPCECCAVYMEPHFDSEAFWSFVGKKVLQLMIFPQVFLDFYSRNIGFLERRYSWN